MSTTSNKISSNALLFILAFIQFISVLDFMIMMPLSTTVIKEFSISMTMFGLLVGSYNISSGIVSVIASFYIDRFDRKQVMLFSFIFFILGTIGCGLSTGFTSMLLSRIVTGMFGGVLSALIFSIVADVYPYKKRGSAMGKVMIGISAAAVLGIPIGNYVAAHFYWQLPFYIIAVLGIVVFFIILFLLPAMKDHIRMDFKSEAVNQLIETFKSPNRLRALLLITLLMFGSFSIIPYIPEYMVNNVGITQEQVSLIYLVGGAASSITLLISGKLSDKYGSPLIYMFLTFVALLPIYFVTNLSSNAGLGMVLLVTSALFMFGGSRNVPANILITSTAHVYRRAGFISIVTATQQLAAGLAAFIGSLLVTSNSDHKLVHYEYIGWFAIGMSLLAIPIAFLVKPIEETTVLDDSEQES